MTTAKIRPIGDSENIVLGVTFKNDEILFTTADRREFGAITMTIHFDPAASGLIPALKEAIAESEAAE